LLYDTKFEYIKKNGGFFVSAKEMKEMERLLEESLKESPPKQRAKKSHEQNLKRKFDEAGIDEENEEEEDDKEEEEEEEEDEEEDKESAFPVNRPSTSFRKPNSKRKGVPHRAPFF
jgi:Ran GTPase-activating protein (RanGAP) involved in mRNA processing and transport